MTGAQDDTTSDYGGVLPLPPPPAAEHAPLGEALLSRLVVAHGLVTREQLRALLAGRAAGDVRPLDALLLGAGLVTPADLERVRRAPPPPGAPDPVTPSGGVPGGRRPSWGAAAVQEVDEAAERTLTFDGVLSPLALAPPVDDPGAPAAPGPMPPGPGVPRPAPAPTPGAGVPRPPQAASPPAPDPERPFSISAMEWDRAAGRGSVGVDEDSSISGEGSARLGRLIRREPRRELPWRLVGGLTLLALVGLAGVRLVAWSHARRQAERRASVDAALRRALLADARVDAASLPDAPEGDALAAARLDLARGAALVRGGEPGPGLVALGRGDAALVTLEPELSGAVERLRARALVSLGRLPDAATALDAHLARAPRDAAALELLADVALRLGRPEEAARRLEAAAASAPDEAARAARALRRVVDLALDWATRRGRWPRRPRRRGQPWRRPPRRPRRRVRGARAARPGAGRLPRRRSSRRTRRRARRPSTRRAWASPGWPSWSATSRGPRPSSTRPPRGPSGSACARRSPPSPAGRSTPWPCSPAPGTTSTGGCSPPTPTSRSATGARRCSPSMGRRRPPSSSVRGGRCAAGRASSRATSTRPRSSSTSCAARRRVPLRARASWSWARRRSARATSPRSTPCS
ncbi:MAG: hypothetical protein M9894_31595 [Planctomycetes bacterium]|nr:hypothetical protein [Planctomycetota bacterium]